MTAIIGILCKNGIVIGSDSSATFTAGTYRTIEQPMEKIEVIDGRLIVASTGSVGLSQRFSHLLRKAWREKLFSSGSEESKSEFEIVKSISRAFIEDMGHTFLKPGDFGVLLAFPFNNRCFLCEFGLRDFQPEFKTEHLWYCSMGSAQTILDPFLGFLRDVFWVEGPPNVYEGIFAATWALQHAIDVNPGGVNGPVRIAVLERDNKGRLFARKVSEDELGEHLQAVDEAKLHLRNVREKYKPEAGADLPQLDKR